MILDSTALNLICSSRTSHWSLYLVTVQRCNVTRWAILRKDPNESSSALSSKSPSICYSTLYLHYRYTGSELESDISLLTVYSVSGQMADTVQKSTGKVKRRPIKEMRPKLHKCEPEYFKVWPKFVRTALAWFTIVLFSLLFLVVPISLIVLPMMWFKHPYTCYCIIAVQAISMLWPMKEWYLAVLHNLRFKYFFQIVYLTVHCSDMSSGRSSASGDSFGTSCSTSRPISRRRSLKASSNAATTNNSSSRCIRTASFLSRPYSGWPTATNSSTARKLEVRTLSLLWCVGHA